MSFPLFFSLIILLLIAFLLSFSIGLIVVHTAEAPPSLSPSSASAAPALLLLLPTHCHTTRLPMSLIA